MDLLTPQPDLDKYGKLGRHRPRDGADALPMIYVAGPYTRPDPVENTHRAIRVGIDLYETKLMVPFVPHVSLLTHLVVPRPYGFWLDYDIHFLAHCDAVYRLNGESSGADDEVAWAHDNDLPVYLEHERYSLERFCEGFVRARR